MYKLLIVDDEAMLRRELCTSFPWESMGFKLLGTASSGEQALEWLTKDPIDAMLLDIRMPGIGGLEALKIIKQNHPKTEIVILSAYDDYRYVREGLKLGAFDYILKIDLITELELTMGRLERRLKEIKSDGDCMADCLEGRTDSIPGWPACPGTRIVCLSSESNRLPREALICGDHAFFPVASPVLDVQGLGSGKGGVSGAYGGTGGHRTMVYQAMRAMDFVVEDAPAPVYDYLKVLHDSSWYDTGEEALMKSMLLGKRDFLNDLDLFVEEIVADPGITIPAAVRIGRRLYSSLLKLAEQDRGKDLIDRFDPIPGPLPRIYDIAAHVRDTLGSLFSETLSHRRSRLSGNIESAQELVKQLYMTNLRIGEMARAVDMSPSNFKIRFKEQTGAPFTVFLQAVRMENAMDLLCRTDLRIYEIANRVGYSDEKYFRKVFRQKTGMTPGGYRVKMSDTPPLF